VRIVQLHDETWDSGIAHYALTLSSALAARGHEVQFWARAGSHAAAEALKAGLETRQIVRPWVSLRALRRELRARGVEIINAHTGSSHSFAAALAAGTGIRVVRTRGDTRPPKINALSRGLARRTRVFITANSRLQHDLRRAFPKSRVELVLQGVAPIGEPGALPGKPLVGILGRLDEVKGHAVLLAAAARTKADILCAGPDPSGRRGELEGLAKSLGLNERCRFLGRVADPAQFINGCRIGVVASTGSEAVSRAALEWMQLGRPLVATAVGCLPDLVENGKTGLLVPPNEPEALAAALARLLGDPAAAEDMGRRARERFHAVFSLELFASETERVYRSVL
jgi:glycosyltransferase involved in cell wall biosynthesis